MAKRELHPEEAQLLKVARETLERMSNYIVPDHYLDQIKDALKPYEENKVPDAIWVREFRGGMGNYYDSDPSTLPGRERQDYVKDHKYVRSES